MASDGVGAGPVLVAGDLNPDLVLRGDVVPRFGQAEQLLTAADLLVGGSAGITAHGLARLERPVALVAAVGADAFGARMREELAAAGVDVSPLLVRDDVPTGLTVVLSQPQDRAILTLLGAIPTLSAEEVLRAAAGIGAAHVHVASLFLQPSLRDTIGRALAELRAAGVTTSLDTNDDPAGTWAGVTPLLPHLDVLLPNAAEARALAGYEDVERAAAVLAGHGPLVVVKDGERGAFAVDAAGECTRVDGTPVEAVDTTGAGDTFDAAFLDAWLAGEPLPEALRRAVQAGALAVGAAGGTAGQPHRTQLLFPERR